MTMKLDKMIEKARAKGYSGDSNVVDKKESTRPWQDGSILHQSNKENKSSDSTKKDKAKETQSATKKTTSTIESTDSSVDEVETKDIIRWKYKDRPENELGDIENLAKDIKTNGQIQPVVLRKLDGNTFELIVGERRWRACKLLNIPVKAVVRAMDDKNAALIQVSENIQRKDLSDYAKALSYKRLIDGKVFQQTELAEKIAKSQSYIRNMLSFFRVNTEIVNLIGDLRFVSARTAYEIATIQDKGKVYIDALKKIAPRISLENMGARALSTAVSKIISNTNAIDNKSIRFVYAGEDGKKLFTIKGDGQHDKSIVFTKDIYHKLNFQEIENVLKELLEKQLRGKETAES